MEVGCARTRCRAGLFERGGGAILIAWAWCAVAVADLPTAEELPPPALEEQLPAEPVLLEPFGHTVGSDTHLAATWAEGLLLRSRGDDFSFRIGGRVQVDANTPDKDCLAGLSCPNALETQARLPLLARRHRKKNRDAHGRKARAS